MNEIFSLLLVAVIAIRNPQVVVELNIERLDGTTIISKLQELNMNYQCFWAWIVLHLIIQLSSIRNMAVTVSFVSPLMTRFSRSLPIWWSRLLNFPDSFLAIHNSFLRLLDLSTTIILSVTFGKEFSTLLREYNLPYHQVINPKGLSLVNLIYNP